MELDEHAPLTFDFGDGPVPAHRHVNGGGWVADSAFVEASALVSGDAQVYGNAWVSGNARVSGNAWVYGDAWVSGDALVYGNARVSGDALVYGNARVSCSRDYALIGPIGSREAFLTWTRSDNSIATGCFRGTVAEFLRAVADTHGDNEYARTYRALIAFLEVIKGA